MIENGCSNLDSCVSHTPGHTLNSGTGTHVHKYTPHVNTQQTAAGLTATDKT